MLLANCLAQSQALMLGKTAARPLPRRRRPQRPARRRQCSRAPQLSRQPAEHDASLLDRLTPRELGALIALYEHRVFTSGAVWGINSFDQWGVELGKALCNDLLPRFASGDTQGLDASTAGLLARLTAA